MEACHQITSNRTRHTSYQFGYITFRGTRRRRRQSVCVDFRGRDLHHAHHDSAARVRHADKYHPDRRLDTEPQLDIGANVGLFSIQIELAKRAASSAFNFSRFLLFEPVPNIYACLTENLRAASIDNGLAFNVALGNADCSAEMVLDQGNGGNNSLLAEAVDPDWAKTLTVQVRTFASFAQSESLVFERPILLKIDVQGYEPNVIAGIPENVWSKVQVALIEFTPLYFSKIEPGIRKGLFDRLAHFSRFTRLSDHSVQKCSLNQIVDVCERG